MGYDLRITRERSPHGEDPISLEEWKAYVDSDPSVELTGYAELTLPDGRGIRIANSGMAVWKGHSGGEPVWLDFRGGSAFVKNPDEETIAKMKVIAGQLGAQVIGDEGETY